MNEVRFGMMGAGKMAHWACERIHTHPRARVSALFDAHAERMQSLAKAWDIRHCFTEAEAICNCPEVDVVYIALPNVFHSPMAKMALKAGKHVLLEKPFAMNYTEALEIAELARQSGLTFMVGMDQRYTEDSQRIVALRKAGRFGDLYYGKAYWFRRTGIPKLGTWFGNKALAGAGAINDIGVHMLDLCLHAMDNFEPVAVFGQTYTKFGHRGLGQGKWGMSDPEGIPFDVDDFATALIKFRNGATVQLEVSWAAHIAEANRLDVEIFGTEAGASLRPACLYETDPATGEPRVVEQPEAEIALPHAEKFHNMANHLLEGEALLVSIDEALAVQRILDAVSESAASGREVRLDT